ncbi:MAG TPA: hypothetical protein VGH32_04505, partial [Pirellulales bacterium]
SKLPRLGVAPAKKTTTDFEVVYVEGSPQQINGLVSDLDANPAEFRSFAVRPAAATKLSIRRQADSARSGIDAVKDLEARDPVASSNRPTGPALGGDRSMSRKREAGGMAGGGSGVGCTRAGGAAAGRTAAGGASNGNTYSFQADAPAAGAPAVPSPPDAKVGRVPMGTLGATQELHGLQQKQADTKGAPSRPNDLARTADKRAPENVNAPAAKEGAAETGVPPAPASFGGAKADPMFYTPSEQSSAQKGKDTPERYQKNESNDLAKHIAGDAPPAVEFRTQSMTEQQRKWSETDSTKQADLGKPEQGQSPGDAFWLYLVPPEAKPELPKEQVYGSKFGKQKVENSPAANTSAAGLAATPKPAPAAPSTPQAGAAAPASPPLAEPARPVAIKGAPTFRATDEPAERSAVKSAKETVPAGAGKPASEKPADDKAGAVTENSVKLRVQTTDDQALPAAMPQTPPPSPPHDGERSFKRGESLADANGDRAAGSSQRMRAIFIFRIAPQPTAAAAQVESGPAPAKP